MRGAAMAHAESEMVGIVSVYAVYEYTVVLIDPQAHEILVILEELPGNNDLSAVAEKSYVVRGTQRHAPGVSRVSETAVAVFDEVDRASRSVPCAAEAEAELEQTARNDVLSLPASRCWLDGAQRRSRYDVFTKANPFMETAFVVQEVPDEHAIVA